MLLNNTSSLHAHSALCVSLASTRGTFSNENIDENADLQGLAVCLALRLNPLINLLNELRRNLFILDAFSGLLLEDDKKRSVRKNEIKTSSRKDT